MPISTATFIASMHIEYPSASGTASLSWAAIQEVKRPIKNSFPNIGAPVLATPQNLNALKGLTGKITDTLSAVSSTYTAQKLGVDSTAVSANHWGNAAKYIQSATPASPDEGDIWFEI